MVTTKIFHIICGILAFAGFILGVGTAGALDLGAEITNGIMFQFRVSLILMVCGAIGLRMTQPEE